MQQYTTKQKIKASAKLLATWLIFTGGCFLASELAKALSLFDMADMISVGVLIGLSAATIFVWFPFVIPEWFIEASNPNKESSGGK
jgi:hypothetical protein